METEEENEEENEENEDEQADPMIKIVEKLDEIQKELESFESTLNSRFHELIAAVKGEKVDEKWLA